MEVSLKTIIRHKRVKEFVQDRHGCNGLVTTWASGESAVGIGIEEDGKVIAGIVFDGYNGASVCMYTSADLPPREWMSDEYMQCCFAYAFEELGAKRVSIWAPEINADERMFALHLGFEHEATLQDLRPDGSIFVYRMAKDMCRYLGVGIAEEDVH